MGKQVELRIALMNMDMTQKRLAGLAGLHPTTVSLIMTGRRAANNRHRAAISRVLGIRADILFS